MKYTTSEEEVNVKKEVETKRKVDHLALGIAYGCSFGLMIGTCLWPFFGFIWVVYGQLAGMMVGMAMGYYKEGRK